MARPKNPANTLHRICPTCKSEFTCEKRKQKTYCSKKCAANSPEIKEKNRQGVAAAFEEKYGGHPMAVREATKENFKASMREKHGVEFASQMADFSEKVKATKKEVYGDENYNNLPQMKATCITRYGADNYRKTDEYRKKYEETCLKKYGVAHASMAPGRKNKVNASTFRLTHKITMFKKFASSDKFKNFEPLFNLDEYDGITVAHNRPYKFRCKRCGGEHEYNLARQYLRCPNCDKNTSTFQSEVADYIKELLPNEPILQNNRTILSPLEIDILIPNKNIAIETNGLYWHSEVSGCKDKNYHLNKTKLTLARGIRLIHISEEEWNLRKDAVKFVLANIITPFQSSNIITIAEISANEKKQFLEQYHLDGNDASMFRLGLFSDGILKAVMTFVKSKFDKSVQWELSRFCSLVGDAALPLFKEFVRLQSPTSVVAYCNRRYFTGETYMGLGFQFVKNGPPTYHYIIDGYQTVESKFNWTKPKLAKKLLSFDPTISEWENMKMNGFDRIWDCGHSKWIWTQ